MGRERGATKARPSNMASNTGAKALVRCLGRRVANVKLLQTTRGGGGGPVASSKPPTSPLVEQDELTWDDGSANPERCLDEFNMYTPGQALGMLVGAFGIMGAFAFGIKLRDKASHVPYVHREVLE